MLVYFSGDWDVLWGYGMLTHGHVAWRGVKPLLSMPSLPTIQGADAESRPHTYEAAMG